MKFWKTRLMAAMSLAASALVVDVTAPAAPAQAYSGGCVQLEPPQGSGSFWRAANHCGYSVIGSFCFMDDGLFSCRLHKVGGFGPIRPGGSEGISAPPPGVSWRAVWCDYDAWNRGQCKTPPPWQGL